MIWNKNKYFLVILFNKSGILWLVSKLDKNNKKVRNLNNRKWQNKMKKEVKPRGGVAGIWRCWIENCGPFEQGLYDFFGCLRVHWLQTMVFLMLGPWICLQWHLACWMGEVHGVQRLECCTGKQLKKTIWKL